MVHVFADKDPVDMADQVLLFTDMGPVIVTDLVLLSTDMDPTVVGLEFLVLATRAVSFLQSMDCLICLVFVQVPACSGIPRCAAANLRRPSCMRRFPCRTAHPTASPGFAV